jgi:hypothetical protein
VCVCVCVLDFHSVAVVTGQHCVHQVDWLSAGHVQGKAWIQFFKTGFIQNGCTDETWAQTIMMNSEFHKRNFLPTVSVYDMWHVQGVVVCSYTDHRPGIWPGMSPCYLSLW